MTKPRLSRSALFVAKLLVVGLPRSAAWTYEVSRSGLTALVARSGPVGRRPRTVRVGERRARQRHAKRHHHRRDQQHHALPHPFSPPFAHLSPQHHRPKERRMEGEARAKAPPLSLCTGAGLSL